MLKGMYGGMLKGMRVASASEGVTLPDGAIIQVYGNDALTRNRQWVQSNPSVTPPENLLLHNNGEFTYSVVSLTVTQNFANGPGGNPTATRLLSTGTSWQATIISQVVPTGTYKFGFKVKSNVGGGSVNIKFGLLASLATQAVDESGWTQCEYAITGTGASQTIYILNNGTNADLLIDEFQLYEVATLPSFESNYGKAMPRIGFKNVIAMDGNAIDTTAGGRSWGIELESHPLFTSFSEGTIIVMTSTVDNATIASKVVSMAGGTGTFDVGVNNGYAYGSPGLLYNDQKETYIAGTGYRMLASKFKAGNQTFYLDGIPLSVKTGTLAAQVKRIIGLFGDHPGNSSSFVYKGKTTVALLFNRWLNDEEIQQAFDYVIYNHVNVQGKSSFAPSNVWLAQGDSLTGLPGSYYYIFTGTNPSGWISRQLGFVGSSITDVIASLPSMIAAVEGAVANGHNPIVSLLIGTNGAPTISEYSTYYSAIRSSGGKMIACTIPHKVDQASENARIDAINADIIAASANYDAIARFDGLLTETVGVDYGDPVHPNASGWAKMEAVMTPILTSLAI